jgi:hypothetical protein
VHPGAAGAAGGQVGAAQLLPAAGRAGARAGRAGAGGDDDRRPPQRRGVPAAQAPRTLRRAGRAAAAPAARKVRGRQVRVASFAVHPTRRAWRARMVAPRPGPHAWDAAGHAVHLGPTRLGHGPPATPAAPTVDRPGRRTGGRTAPPASPATGGIPHTARLGPGTHRTDTISASPGG